MIWILNHVDVELLWNHSVWVKKKLRMLHGDHSFSLIGVWRRSGSVFGLFGTLKAQVWAVLAHCVRLPLSLDSCRFLFSFDELFLDLELDFLRFSEGVLAATMSHAEYSFLIDSNSVSGKWWSSVHLLPFLSHIYIWWQWWELWVLRQIVPLLDHILDHILLNLT